MIARKDRWTKCPKDLEKRVKILVLNWILQHEGLRFSQDSLIHFHGGLELDKSRGPSILVPSGSGERMPVAWCAGSLYQVRLAYGGGGDLATGVHT